MALKLLQFKEIKKKKWVHTCIDSEVYKAIEAHAQRLSLPKMHIINAALAQTLLEDDMGKKTSTKSTKKASTKTGKKC